jgi:hypothetical protein
VIEGRSELLKVRIYAYDGRRNRTSTRSTATISAVDPDGASEELVATLMPFLSASRIVRRRPQRPRPSAPWFQRFRSSRFFWPVVGAGAAIVAASIGIGIYYGVRDEGPDRRRHLLLLPVIPPGR